jgi:periplasmic protein TonB
MKILLLLLFPFLSIAQTDTLRFDLDKDFNILPDGSQPAYIRKVYREQTAKKWTVKDYYLSGKLQMVGEYNEPELLEKNGHFVWYDSLGNKQLESDFLNNVLVGSDTYYYSNGNIDFIMEYDSKGKYRKTTYFKEDASGESEIIPAEFAAGQKAMYGFIFKNIRNPREQDSNIKGGKVFARFDIDTEGKILDIEVLASPHTKISEEIIRLIQSMPPWTPGTRDGKPFKTTFYLPVLFK